MLSDVERRRLSEIDAWFQRTDPELARRLAHGPARSGRRFAVIAVSIVVMTAVGCLIGWLAGPAAGIAAALSVAALGTGCLLQTRHHRWPTGH